MLMSIVAAGSVSGALSISVVMYWSIDGARIAPALVCVELIRRPAASKRPASLSRSPNVQ
jgi:hypothetical protein